MKISIYTDGACEVHNSKASGWGAVLIYKDEIKEIFGGELYSTNNRAEILAVIKALECIKTTHIPIEVFSDSQYVVRCFKEKWYLNWKANNWRSKRGKVKNIELWKQLIELVEKQSDISFHKVKAHAGIEFNELADSLANIGLEEVKKIYSFCIKK